MLTGILIALLGLAAGILVALWQRGDLAEAWAEVERGHKHADELQGKYDAEAARRLDSSLRYEAIVRGLELEIERLRKREREHATVASVRDRLDELGGVPEALPPPPGAGDEIRVAVPVDPAAEDPALRGRPR